MNALDQVRHEFVRHHRCITNKAAKTPEHRVQLTDDSVLLKFEEPRNRNLRVHIFSHSGRVITACGESQIRFFNFDWDLSETEITGRRTGIEGRRAVDV